jgi:hypothetical protein
LINENQIIVHLNVSQMGLGQNLAIIKDAVENS